MKFRKKPVVIDHPDISYSLPHNEGDLIQDFRWNRHWIQTLEGPHIVSNGDWIITGIKGEKYPCKPDIFEATYEAVIPASQ